MPNSLCDSGPSPARATSPIAVTIVLPVYNGERFLREALDSIFSQTLQDWELLIGDDQSNDRSEEIVAAYRDSRVSYRRNASRRGIFGNLNDLIAQARTGYVKIFCQDDVMAPSCLESQLRFMRARPLLAYSRVMQWDNGARAFKEQDAAIRSLPEVISPSDAALAFFLFGNIPGNLSNTMLNTLAWRETGGFREDLPYAGDMEFWFRVGVRRPFGVLHERLNFVRCHTNQASVFLNRENELVAQADEVLDRIYRSLPPSTRSRVVTRLWGTINFVAQDIHRAIRISASGGSPNWKSVMRHRSYAYSFPLAALLYVLTANRRFGLHAAKERLMTEFRRTADSA